MICPLLSQYVRLLAMAGSVMAGWMLPAVSVARDVMLCSPVEGLSPPLAALLIRRAGSVVTNTKVNSMAELNPAQGSPFAVDATSDRKKLASLAAGG